MDQSSGSTSAAIRHFALLLEAQRRSCAVLLHARPATLRDGRYRRRADAHGARQRGGSFYSRRTAHGRSRYARRRAVRQDRRSTSPISRPRTFSSDSSEDAGRQRSRPGPQRAGKGFRHRLSDLMPPTLITATATRSTRFARAGATRDEAALRQGRRGSVPVTREDLNFGSLFDLFTTMFHEPWVVQKFLRR